MNQPEKNPNNRTRRQHSGEEKVRLLRLHLLEGKPISALCEEHDLHPTQFYQWQKTFFENGAAAFDRAPRSRSIDVGKQRIEQLEAKLKRKDEVIALVTEELVRTKKEIGED
ncbi:MAG: transposase [Verrucomicrobiales bacterium]